MGVISTNDDEVDRTLRLLQDGTSNWFIFLFLFTSYSPSDTAQWSPGELWTPSDPVYIMTHLGPRPVNPNIGARPKKSKPICE